MSRKGVAKALAVLTAAYQREMNDASIALYVEHLEDIDDNLLMKSANDLIIRSTYFPTIATIRDYCARVVLGDALPPDTSFAWNQVIGAVSSQGTRYRPQWTHALIGLALDEVGGYYHACMTTTIESLRIRFEKVYERMRNDTIKAVAVTRFDYRGAPQALEAKHATQKRRSIEADDAAQTGLQEESERTPRAKQSDSVGGSDKENL